MKALLVYITTPDSRTASAMAKALVGERLCACANIIDGMESMYWWRGTLENSTESILLCKTTEAAYPALETRARELHPYETPCIVALPLERGLTSFMRWIAEETRS